MAGKYQTPRGQSATDAKRKYNEQNYDRVYLVVRKGKKAVYQAAAKRRECPCGNGLKPRLTLRRRNKGRIKNGGHFARRSL